MAGGRSLWDQLIAGTGDAIADIREKLVEEPWFGRTLDVPVSDLGQSPPGQDVTAPGSGDIQPSIEKERVPEPEQDMTNSIDI